MKKKAPKSPYALNLTQGITIPKRKFSANGADRHDVAKPKMRKIKHVKNGPGINLTTGM